MARGAVAVDQDAVGRPMNEKPPLTPTVSHKQVLFRLLLLLSLLGITAWATYTLRLRRPTGIPALSNVSLMPVGEWYTVADQTPSEPLVLTLTRDHEQRRVRIGGVAEPKDAAEAHRALEGRQTTGKVLLVP